MKQIFSNKNNCEITATTNCVYLCVCVCVCVCVCERERERERERKLTRIITIYFLKRSVFWGAWVAQSVECPTSAQIMTSQFMSLSPTSGSVLTARSLETALDSVSPSLSLLFPHSCSVSLKKR